MQGQGYPYSFQDPIRRNQPQSSPSRTLEGFDTEDDRFSFNERSVRMAFIRKVYSILTVQILVTAGIIAFFVLHQGVRAYVEKNPSLLWIAVGITFVVIVMLACCGDLRRRFPINVICLAIFTLAEGCVLGMVSLRYSVDTILIAALMTAVLTAGLTVFAFQTKCDFTAFGGILCAAMLILFVCSLVSLLFPSKIFILIISSASALLFSIFIVYDTQLMIGGNHKANISPEDYVFAALNLYIDIVILFHDLLTILGILGDD